MSTIITIPLINPNEPEALLAEVNVREGQSVQAEEVLCTLETTKTTAEVTAEKSGFVIGLQLSAGQTVRAGDVLCYLADSPEETIPALESGNLLQPQTASEMPPGLRITEPAAQLAAAMGLDLRTLPVGPLVTEKMVRTAHQSASLAAPALPTASFDPTAVIIYGGGGHGKSLIDLVRSLGFYRIVGVVDDGIPSGTTILGVPVLGGTEKLAELHADGVRLALNAVGGIGNVSIRLKIFDRLASAGFACPTVVHPSAVIEPSASLEAGIQVMPHAYIGSEAKIGYGAIINTGAIVSHECVIGEFANLSPGSILAGQVQVGSAALVGMGVTVNLQVKIGRQARIGNSAVIKQDVPDNGVVRAGTSWPE